MSDRILRPAMILGLLSCIGPFAIDMYLPAMPMIGDALGAPITAMQTTITAYFIAFGLAQLIYGPWADQGRAQAAALCGYRGVHSWRPDLRHGLICRNAVGGPLCAGAGRGRADGGAARHHPRPRRPETRPRG